jgi:hypothetical protein
VIDAAGARIFVVVFGLAAALAACSKAPIEDAPPQPAATAADHFGPGFAQAFRASPDAAPINPSTASVIPVDPNGKPVRIR